MVNEFEGKLIEKRIWFPKNIRKLINNKFCKFSIKNNRKSISFISKLNKDGRLIIPKRYKISDSVCKVNFKIIRSVRRPKKLLSSKGIDILSFIPDKTVSGFDILVTTKNKKIFLWYFASKGRPNEILLRRYVNSEFYRLLGYYRAEGGKIRISKRRGREFSFTNKSIEIISDFIRILRCLIDTRIIRVSISYNRYFRSVSVVKRQLVRMGINVNNIYTREARGIRNFIIRLYVTNSLLSETINNAEVIVRKNILSNENTDYLAEYLRGVIAGDGSFYSWVDYKGSNHNRLQIFEAEEDAIKDISEMLSNIGIRGTYKRAKSRMFIYTAYLNWECLLNLHRFELLWNKNSRLQDIIKKHKRYSSLKYMTLLPKEFVTSDFGKISGKSYGYCATWLRDRDSEGLLKKSGKARFQNKWKMTDVGESLAGLLKTV